MKCNNTISVIVPSYNHGIYIEETLKSIIEQDYEGVIEIIIVDDCSSDNTLNILRNFENLKLENRKIIVHRKTKNKGLNDSIEIGLKYSAGSYVQLLASDDIILKNKLSVQLNYLIEKKYDGIYSTGYILNDNNLSEINLSSFKKAYESGYAYQYICSRDFNAPLLQSGLFKKELFINTIELRKNFKSDDWAFAIEVFKNYNIGYLDKYLFIYRNHEGNTYKKYLITFPMRVDVISRLVPIEIQSKAYSNIFYSHGVYLIDDKKIILGLKFVFSSFILNPSLEKSLQILKLLVPKKLRKIIKKYIIIQRKTTNQKVQ